MKNERSLNEETPAASSGTVNKRFGFFTRNIITLVSAALVMAFLAISVMKTNQPAFNSIRDEINSGYAMSILHSANEEFLTAGRYYRQAKWLTYAWRSGISKEYSLENALSNEKNSDTIRYLYCMQNYEDSNQTLSRLEEAIASGRRGTDVFMLTLLDSYNSLDKKTGLSELQKVRRNEVLSAFTTSSSRSLSAAFRHSCPFSSLSYIIQAISSKSALS